MVAWRSRLVRLTQQGAPKTECVETTARVRGPCPVPFAPSLTGSCRFMFGNVLLSGPGVTALAPVSNRKRVGRLSSTPAAGGQAAAQDGSPRLRQQFLPQPVEAPAEQP
ncbi:hypothetical protein SRO_6746 [Streptomyces rochei]|nr:hypothetical protein SRO_6746 [Streptomyces rochei]